MRERTRPHRNYDRTDPIAATMREIGEDLGQIRVDQGISKRKLAVLAGLGWHTVDELERGLGSTLISLITVAHALDYDVFVEFEPRG